MIEFHCTHCDKKLKVSDEAAGKRGRCSRCGTVLQIPEATQQFFHVEPPPVEYITPPPRIEAGHIIQAPSVNVHLPKRTSSLGVVAVILGVVGFLLCWIPLVGILTIPISGLGLLLGVVGLLVSIFRNGSGIGYPIAGVGVSAFALLIAITQVAAIGRMAESISASSRQSMATNQKVVDQGIYPTPAGVNEPEPAKELTAPTKPQTTKPTNSPAAAAEWASARTAVRQGNIELRVSEAVVGKIPIKNAIGRGDAESNDVLLKLVLELRNISQSKKLDYSSWSGGDFSFDRDFATLKDNFGNAYKRINFGFAAQVVGQIKSESIYPGKSINDTIVFERPIDGVQHLDLELPASNFDGDGMLRIRIPADLIKSK